jgi:hypothetical protein
MLICARWFVHVLKKGVPEQFSYVFLFWKSEMKCFFSGKSKLDEWSLHPIWYVLSICKREAAVKLKKQQKNDKRNQYNSNCVTHTRRLEKRGCRTQGGLKPARRSPISIGAARPTTMRMWRSWHMRAVGLNGPLLLVWKLNGALPVSTESSDDGCGQWIAMVGMGTDRVWVE